MQDLELEGLLRQLKLVDIRENCDDLVSEAIEKNEGYRDFLKRIFRYEIEYSFNPNLSKKWIRLEKRRIHLNFYIGLS